MTKIRLSAKDAIIEAGFSLLVDNPSVSLIDIAEKAGVGRATLHRYFATRDDLIRTIAEIAITEMDEAVHAACKDIPTYSEALWHTLNTLIPLADRYGFMAHTSFVDDPVLKKEFDRLQTETVEMVAAAKKEGLFDPTMPTLWIVRMFDYVLCAAWESINAGEVTHEQATDLAWRTLTIEYTKD